MEIDGIGSESKHTASVPRGSRWCGRASGRGEGTGAVWPHARLAGVRVPVVWPCVWPGRPGSSWRREVIGAWGGVGTADAHEAVATTDVGRGGGGVLGVAGRVVWEQGERNQRRTQGRRWHWYIYAMPLYSRCHPPTGSKGPLLPVRVTNRE